MGLIGSQWLPAPAGPSYLACSEGIRILTTIGLSFIMIRVGYEFEIDKKNLAQYGWDYFVAFTAAGLPWIFVSLYFIFVLLPPETWSHRAAWQETLQAGRFAAPTSAGVLFSMLAAAGLGATWLYRKARILAIFDDLDTILLMIPLKMLIVGPAWQLGFAVFVMLGALAAAHRYLHAVRIPISWPWVVGYASVIVVVCEIIDSYSKIINLAVPIHIEVLLPAFALGCMIAAPRTSAELSVHGIFETESEQRAETIVAALFLFLVGLSMPPFSGGHGIEAHAARITAEQPTLPWTRMSFHVAIVTALANNGKMFPAFCYKREAHWRERLALAVGMWPRGEVGAGVLVVSIGYGIGGPIVTIAMLSLALNLLLTGAFIYIVKAITCPMTNLSASGPVLADH